MIFCKLHSIATSNVTLNLTMHVHCENLRNDKTFPIFLLGLAIAIPTIISVEKRWCNAVNEDSYSFNYVINTDGIISQHVEERQFDLTRGSYSFLQPDGQIRLVSYQVDGKKGFRAVVKYHKLSGNLMGHLSYPRDFAHPVVFAMPVSLITNDLFKSKTRYPNLPK